jgi:hypothetical protein
LAIGGGPLVGVAFVALPCGLALALSAKCGFAAKPGAQPASNAVATITDVAIAACRLMPTTVAKGVSMRSQASSRT